DRGHHGAADLAAALAGAVGGEHLGESAVAPHPDQVVELRAAEGEVLAERPVDGLAEAFEAAPQHLLHEGGAPSAARTGAGGALQVGGGAAPLADGRLELAVGHVLARADERGGIGGGALGGRRHPEQEVAGITGGGGAPSEVVEERRVGAGVTD